MADKSEPKGIRLFFKMNGRRISFIGLGYLLVAVFILAFRFSMNARGWLDLPAAPSETTAILLAVLFTAPLLLPFLWNRLAKIKFGDLEIELADVKADSKTAFIFEFQVELEEYSLDTHRVVHELLEKPLDLYAPISETLGEIGLVKVIREAEHLGVLVVDLDEGQAWWSTRLFLLAALAEEFTQIQQIIFLETREKLTRFLIGYATPWLVTSILADKNPDLKTFFETARKPLPSEPDQSGLEAKVIRITENYIRQFSARGGEPAVKEWVNGAYLGHSSDLGQALEWDGKQPGPLLLHSILNRNDRYVPLVNKDRQFVLVVDRQKLAEQVALKVIRQQLS